MPALQTYIIEPVWEQLCALLPERDLDHPLGCHRARICERVVFEKLVQVLVFGGSSTGGSPTKRVGRDHPASPMGRVDREAGAMWQPSKGSPGTPTTGSWVWISGRRRWTAASRRLPAGVRRRAVARWIAARGGSNARWP
jgi:hypothetical protein